MDFGTDQLLLDVADYVVGFEVESAEAMKTARYCVNDVLGTCACRPNRRGGGASRARRRTQTHAAAPPRRRATNDAGITALNSPECTKLLGPVVPGQTVPHGAHVPGTDYYLDPVQAAFNIGTCKAWGEYSDSWQGADWISPSDTIAAILAVAEYLSSLRLAKGFPALTVREVLIGVTKAYEVCGILATDNALNQVGVESALFVKVAATSVCTRMLGGGRREVISAASQAFVDGSGLRCYRHFPNVGTRKAWCAGDTASRAVFLALLTMRGEMGYPLVLSAPVWGFNDVYHRRASLNVSRDYGTYIIENVVFKVSFPGDVHAQTAMEVALRLHPQVVHRVDEVLSITIYTSRSTIRTIDKTSPLRNPSDRETCLQYCVAVSLLYGTVTVDHFSDAVAQDPRIDELRSRMTVRETPQFSSDYVDPEKMSLASAIQVHFKDRTSTSRLEVEYPLGHRRRRLECFPALEKKLMMNLSSRMPATRATKLFETCMNPQHLDKLSVPEFLELFCEPPPNHVLTFGGERLVTL